MIYFLFYCPYRNKGARYQPPKKKRLIIFDEGMNCVKDNSIEYLKHDGEIPRTVSMIKLTILNICYQMMCVYVCVCCYLDKNASLTLPHGLLCFGLIDSFFFIGFANIFISLVCHLECLFL